MVAPKYLFATEYIVAPDGIIASNDIIAPDDIVVDDSAASDFTGLHLKQICPGVTLVVYGDWSLVEKHRYRMGSMAI